MSNSFLEIHNYHHRTKSSEEKRALAVAAALTIIQAKSSNTPTDCEVVSDEIGNLSKYADQIQEALTVK